MARIREIKEHARRHGVPDVPAWPAIVLRTPKGWTGPKVVNGEPVEGTFRSHQVPLARVRDDPGQLAMLETWMRSYRPETLSDAAGRLVPELGSLAPEGDRRMGANPHVNGGRRRVDLDLPPLEDYAIEVHGTPRASVASRRGRSAG